MAEQAAKKIVSAQAKPILKWAGGKTQMLGDLLPKVPTSFGRYIEPFFGGGAMFFALQPENAVIADSNPELINMYREVADHVEDVIQCLKQYENTSEMFYAVRSQEWTTLPKAEAAARTIFLNRTCFNGLYRVNKQGQFNVPYGKYKNPKICDEDGLRAASVALQKVDILCGDYLLVLEHYAQPGDFIFLDPPYLPVSEYADFKRYTKEQFYEEDHIELSKMIMALHERGCYVILTNSNHPLVHELYAPFNIDVIQTKRHISCNGSTRKGEDVIVTIPPKQRTLIKLLPQPLPEQVSAYPPTRFMGSKSKLLSEIWSVASQFKVNTVVDLFSGSGIVVSDAVLKYDKPVYGMFVAVRIDTNTAETFKHGIWYAKGDVKQRLDIVPLTLVQFQKYFVAMFESNKSDPQKLRDLILQCESRRDILEAPAWKEYIDTTVSEKANEIASGIVVHKSDDAPLVPAGAVVRHVTFGEGQVVALEASFPECPAKTVEIPYLRSLPDAISFCADGRTLLHDRFGEGTVLAYTVVFQNQMLTLSYPAAFKNGCLAME